jgi:hypothetical protein
MIIERGDYFDSIDFSGYSCIDGWRRSINESQVGRPGGSTPRFACAGAQGVGRSVKSW